MHWLTISTVIGAIGWFIAVAMVFVVPVNRKPSSATAWLLLIVLLPYIGLLLFLVLGNPKLPKRRRDEQRKMSQLIGKIVANTNKQTGKSSFIASNVPVRFQPFIKLNTNLTNLPAVGGNRVEVISQYQTVFEKIAKDIDRATSFVHVEYFALSRDEQTAPVFTAMERAAARGVRVRVLFDHLGSRKYPGFKQLPAWFDSIGIEHHLALPAHFIGKDYTRIDLRNHRKIVVVDGHTGYTGSQNLIQRNYFRKDAIYYDELVARISGPVVAELEAAFATDWYCEAGELLADDSMTKAGPVKLQRAGDELCQILPSGSGFEDENNLKLFTSLIHAARQKLVITNPYFVPDDALMTAITSAAQRGVAVTLINSEASDQFLVSHAERSYYEELLRAGVTIYRYKAPILLHSKHITVDDDIAVIGSSNMDIRSFQLNLEVTLVCYGANVVSDLRRVEEADIRKSKRVTLSDWIQRPQSEKLYENIARLTAALQ